jgi:dolichyl-phosphate-mannose-protein mannosyltransferase
MQTKALEKLQRFASKPSGQVFLVILTLAVSLLVRLLLFRLEGFDEPLFAWWRNIAANQGLSGFYDATGCGQGSASCCDYPPLSVYIFRLFGWLAHAIGHDSFTNLGYVDKVLLRLPQNLFDLGTAYLIFRFVRQRYSFLFALGAMAVYALNPATIFDLAVWGQMDSVYTFFMVASLYAVLRSKYELSGGLFALAILTKPQSIVLLPVLAYLILRNGGWKRALSSSAVFLVVVFLVILPFQWDNPVKFIYDRYTEGYVRWQYNSVNAYNFWALLGFWKPDTVLHWGLSYQTWGIIAFVIFAAFVMWQFHRKPGGRAPIFAVFLLMFGFFMLMTRMHERYLFPVFALLAMSFSPRHPPWLYVGLMGTFFANLVYVLSMLNAGKFIPDGHWSIYVLVPINAILFFYAIWSFWRMQRAKKVEAEPPGIPPVPPEPKPPEMMAQMVSPPSPRTEVAEEEPSPPVAKVPTPWTHALILALLIAIFLGVSLWNLGDRKVPTSDWVPQKEPEEVYVDLGTVTLVEKVWVLVADDNTVNVDLYWGSPGNWTYQTNLTESSVWYKWDSLNLDCDTRYVRLLFKGTSARIGEIALFTDGRKLNISSITGDQDNTVTALIDEQQLVGNPASHTSGTYWDEIYYTRTAEQTLKLKSPSQWDHPPTSKLIMAAGIAVFGHNPFAWRIGGVIFAALGILLVYFFAKRVFKSSRAGLIAAFLLTFEFMHFVEARIAVPETYVFFFVIAMFYFFYRYWEDPQRNGKHLFLSLVFFGLGFSTKWTVMYGFGGMLLLLIVLKLCKPVICKNEVLWFVGGLAAAVAIYMASYTTYFLAGHGAHDFWHMQFDMYRFHANLTATHPASSPWWSWPVMLRPVWMYVGSFDGSTGYISTLGNPALWWAGIAAMLGIFWLAIKHRNNIAIFISIPFLIQWLVFLSVHRVIFIYHFFPNVLFIILAITLWIQWLWDKYKWGKWVVAGYLVLNVICFALFFPVLSGLPMSQGYLHSLKWMVDWITGGVGPH